MTVLVGGLDQSILRDNGKIDGVKIYLLSVLNSHNFVVAGI